MLNVIGIILGGGRGGRLYPLTKYRSKPAVPIAGKYRLIDIPVSNCIHSGVERIFILTQFNSASLNRHVSLTYNFDAFREGFVGILAAEQTMDSMDWFQGTADAVRQTMRHFQRFDPDDYLILAGDHIYQMDYRRMIATHQDTGADITVAVSPVSREEAGELGILSVDAKGRISSFAEKPQSEKDVAGFEIKGTVRDKFGLKDSGRCLLGSMGIYLFKAEALKSVLKEYDHTDFGRHIIPAAIRNLNVCAHVFDGYWRDVGTIRSFYEANMDLLSPEPNFHFFDEPFKVFTHARFLPGSKILSVTAERSLICEGCHIEGANLKNALIGVRTIVNPGARIENSYIMGADYYEDDPESAVHQASDSPPVGIGEGTVISGAIVDKNARIGRGVSITPKEPHQDDSGPAFMVKDGITVILKDAVIPDGAVI